MTEILKRFPECFHQDLERAIKILKDEGCTHVFIFGSLAEGNARKNSDIDLAIKGCPSDRYFHILGKLLMELEHSVDLVNLDRDDAFSRHLEKEGGLIYVS